MLDRAFFAQDVVTLSKALIGKILCRNIGKEVVKVMIVETEAYDGPDDKACHAHNNKRTPRTAPMFNKGGHLYIFTIYGPTNYMVNITAGKKDKPEAVLIRAGEPVGGIEKIKELR